MYSTVYYIGSIVISSTNWQGQNIFYTFIDKDITRTDLTMNSVYLS